MRTITLPVNQGSSLNTIIGGTTEQGEPGLSSSVISLSLSVGGGTTEQDESFLSPFTWPQLPGSGAPEQEGGDPKQDEVTELGLPLGTLQPLSGSKDPKQEGGDPKQDEVTKPGLLLDTLPQLFFGSNHRTESGLSLLNESSQILRTSQKPARPDIIEPQEQRFDPYQFHHLISERLTNYYKKQVELESDFDKSLQLIYKSIESKETNIVPALVKAHNLVAQCNEAELRKEAELSKTDIIKTRKEGGNEYTIPLTQTPPEEKQNITIIDKVTGYLYMATFKQENGSYQMQCSCHPELHEKSEEQLFTEMCQLVKAERHIVNVAINSKSIKNVFGYPNLDTLNQELQPGPNLFPTSARSIQGRGRSAAA